MLEKYALRKYVLPLMAAWLFLLALMAAGCGSGKDAEGAGQAQDMDGVSMESGAGESGLAHETAADGHVDFEALQRENPDIFAWLYVPGTDIDMPVLQSPVSDDFYKNHTANGIEGQEGALYTENV